MQKAERESIIRAVGNKRESDLMYGIGNVLYLAFAPMFYHISTTKNENPIHPSYIFGAGSLQLFRAGVTLLLAMGARQMGAEVPYAILAGFGAAGCIDLAAVGFQFLGAQLSSSRKENKW